MYVCYIVSVFLIVFTSVGFTTSHVNYIISNALDEENSTIEFTDVDIINLIDVKQSDFTGDKVDIKCYYECLCPDCRNFDTMSLEAVVQKLSQYIELHTYPYGNAKTFEKDGKVVFQCQHGPEECYGNKLHACALDIVSNTTQAVLYNICMMDSSRTGRGSDDAAADECGKSMSVNSEPIKQCAKGDRGIKLLKYYGDESNRVNYDYVPYILIDDQVNNGNNFFRDVCAAFKNPLPACSQP